MDRVLVVGAGFMGAGIAQVCAQSGRRVDLMDVDAKALDRALAGMQKSLAKLADKGLISDRPEDVLAQVTPVTDPDSAAEADWVIESAWEDEALKLDLFRRLDELAPEETPLASNTSSIPISRLAGATRHPERVLGLHFFVPVVLSELVEVVRGEQTSDAVFRRGLDLARSLGKTPVKVSRDVPGFVMNRVFSAAFREAVDLVTAGVTTPEDVDAGMRLGYGWTAGPFEIVDQVGLDTVARIGRFLKSVGETDLYPRSDLVERLVEKGRLGRKTGRGFYEYGPDGKPRPPDQD